MNFFVFPVVVSLMGWWEWLHFFVYILCVYMSAYILFLLRLIASEQTQDIQQAYYNLFVKTFLFYHHLDNQHGKDGAEQR